MEHPVTRDRLLQIADDPSWPVVLRQEAKQAALAGDLDGVAIADSALRTVLENRIRLRAGQPGVPDDLDRLRQAVVDGWRTLRGAELEDAMLRARWFVHPNDVIGGWSVTPADLPPSSGVPEVATFLSEQAARHITDLHNTSLEDA